MGASHSRRRPSLRNRKHNYAEARRRWENQQQEKDATVSSPNGHDRSPVDDGFEDAAPTMATLQTGTR